MSTRPLLQAEPGMPADRCALEALRFADKSQADSQRIVERETRQLAGGQAASMSSGLPVATALAKRADAEPADVNAKKASWLKSPSQDAMDVEQAFVLDVPGCARWSWSAELERRAGGAHPAASRPALVRRDAVADAFLGRRPQS